TRRVPGGAGSPGGESTPPPTPRRHPFSMPWSACSGYTVKEPAFKPFYLTGFHLAALPENQAMGAALRHEPFQIGTGFEHETPKWPTRRVWCPYASRRTGGRTM